MVFDIRNLLGQSTCIQKGDLNSDNFYKFVLRLYVLCHSGNMGIATQMYKICTQIFRGSRR